MKASTIGRFVVVVLAVFGVFYLLGLIGRSVSPAQVMYTQAPASAPTPTPAPVQAAPQTVAQPVVVLQPVYVQQPPAPAPPATTLYTRPEVVVERGPSLQTAIIGGVALGVEYALDRRLQQQYYYGQGVRVHLTLPVQQLYRRPNFQRGRR